VLNNYLLKAWLKPALCPPSTGRRCAPAPPPTQWSETPPQALCSLQHQVNSGQSCLGSIAESQKLRLTLSHLPFCLAKR